MNIRRAAMSDIDTCQRIARSHSKWLPFVRRDSLRRAIDNGELFVAQVDDTVVGFVNWHGRRDGWSTVYDLAVAKGYEGQGVGRALLYAVPCPIRLKCTADNPANQFYAGTGMRLSGTELAQSGRALNVYELRILTVIVRGANRDVPDIARKSGCAYGVRHDQKAQGWPFMVDVEWKRLKRVTGEWQRVLDVVAETHPVMAMVQDWEPEVSRAVIEQQIADLRALGVLRIMVCPKQDDVIQFIPQDCVVAVSIPTDYAGYLPRVTDLKGRMVHLLGGTPHQQKEYIVKYAGVGARVLSTDGNKHIGVAQKGTTYHDGMWRMAKSREKVDLAGCSLYSSGNIQTELNAAADWEQPLLFKVMP